MQQFESSHILNVQEKSSKKSKKNKNITYKNKNHADVLYYAIIKVAVDI